MAATKTFKTTFQLAAKYTGAPAFGALNRDIDRTQRNAKQTAGVFGRVFGKAGSIAIAVGGTIAAFEGLRKAVDLGKWAFDAAKQQKKAHDIVRQSSQRLAAEGRLPTKDIEKRTQETIALAEAMNKAGGLDAETLAVGLSDLNKFLTSKQIDQMSKGWQDWMVKIHKGAPTLEEARADVDKLNEYIKRGRPAALAALGLTKEQADAISKQVKGHTAAERAQSRAAAIAKILSKETGEMARWLDTDAGKAYLAENALEDLGETAMKSAVAAQRELNIALTDLYKALLPVAELINKEMTPAVQNFTKWLGDNKENIVKWGETAVTWTSNVVNWFKWLQQQSENVFKPIWQNTMKELDALIAVWQNVEAGASKAWEGIKTIWDAATSWFSNLAIKIGEAIAPVYDWIIKPFKKAFEWIISNDPAKGYIPPTTGSGTTGTGGGEPGDYSPPWQEKAVQQGGTGQFYSASNTKATTSSGVLGGVLTGKEAAFEAAGARHGVDPKLLMAIAEFETGHGKSYSARTRNNIAGIMDGKRHRVYGSIEEGIEAQAALLKRGYISQGRTTIPAIGAKYSPPGASNDPNRTNSEWPSSVQREYDRISRASSPKLKDMIKQTSIAPKGTGTGQNNSMAPTINIHGVPTDRQGAVAKEVTTALRSSTKEFNDHLLRSQKDLNRRGYV